MEKKKFRLCSWLLVVSLLLGMLNLPGIAIGAAAVEVPTATSYVGIDKTTKSEWIGAYGGTQAILIGKGFESFTADAFKTGEDLSWAYESGQCGVGNKVYQRHLFYKYDYISNPDSGISMNAIVGTMERTTAFELSNGLVLDLEKPADAYDLFDQYVAFTSFSNATVEDETGTWGRRIHAITMPDEETTYVMTVYLNNFFGTESQVRLAVADAAGENILCQQTFNYSDFNNGGAYVSFLVKGSFRFYVDKLNGSEWAQSHFGVGAFFFDVLVDNFTSGLAAVEADGVVGLTWEETDAPEGSQVVIQKKEASATEWSNAATVDAGVKSWQDTNVVVGSTYEYRLYVKTETGMSVSGESVEAASAEEVEVNTFLGIDKTTKSEWIGAYGGTQAILIGKGFESFTADAFKTGEDLSWAYESGQCGVGNKVYQRHLFYKYDYISNPDSGITMDASAGGERTAAFELAHDLTIDLEKPEGAYDLFDQYVAFTAFSNQSVTDDAGTWGRRIHNVTMPDEETTYVLTVYLNNFFGTESQVRLAVADAAGENILCQQTFNYSDFNGGAYVSFLVKGSFKLYVDKLNGSEWAQSHFGVGAFFFDVLVDNITSGLTAAEADGAVNLTWEETDASVGSQVVIQKKEASATEWTNAATVNAGVKSWQDTDVTAGNTYEYRLYVKTETGMSVSGESVQIVTEVDIVANEYVGIDKTTGSKWIGVYGDTQAILPGRGIPSLNKDDFDASAWFDPFTGVSFNGVSTPCHYGYYGYDYISNPASSITVAFPGERTVAYEVSSTLQLDLEKPADASDFYGNYVTQVAFNNETVQDGLGTWGRRIHTVDVPDDGSTYLFTVYMNNFFKLDSDVRLILTDSTGTVILAEEIFEYSDFNGGAYVSFLISGDCKLYVDKLNGSGSADQRFMGVGAFFFDKVDPSYFTTGLIVGAGEEPRTVNLTWSASNLPENCTVSVMRKQASGTAWQEIATLNGTATSYVDASDLTAGETYEYRIRAVSGTDTVAYSNIAKIELEYYTITSLSFDSEKYQIANSETELTVKVTMLTDQGAPIVGKPVTLNLEWPAAIGASQSVGPVQTDENGVATFVFCPDYMGSGVITAVFDDDDTDKLMHSQATAELFVGESDWTAAPVIWKLSDGIAPGEMIGIYGYGMDEEDVVVMMAPHTSDNVAAEPGDDAISIPVIQYDYENGSYVMAHFPESAEAGLYDVWVKNSYGWSNSLLLNQARPLFISEYEAWNGLTIKVSGRAMDASQFGAEQNTILRLVNGSDIYVQTLGKITPYALAFTVNAPMGTYEVQISNDGGTTWSGLASGQTLTVIEKGVDPLGTGLAWMSNFNWDTEYDAADYGADGTDTADDTDAINAAMAAAATNGGGVVKMADGNYYVSNLKIPAGVILMGESQDGTVLLYNGTGGGNMIEGTADTRDQGRVGLAKFTIKMSNDYRPDAFIWLGHDWVDNYPSHTNSRTAVEMFMYQLNVYTHTTLWSGTPRSRGIGAVYLGKERMLVQECTFTGLGANLGNNYVNEYITYKNNTFLMEEGTVYCSANYSFIEGNYVKGRFQEMEDDEFIGNTHGICISAWTHVEDNFVTNVGAREVGDMTSAFGNDGETYLVESQEYLDYGYVIDATSTTITVRAEDGTLNDPATKHGYSRNRFAIRIVDGRGLGQMKEIKSINLETGEIVLAESWDVVPDSTSKFVLTLPLECNTFYRNADANSAKGVYLFGQVDDTVVAEHTSNGTEGISIFTAQVVNNRLWTATHIDIRDNNITGYSMRSKHTMIGYYSERSIDGGNFYATGMFGIEIRNNIIDGVSKEIVPVGGTDSATPSGVTMQSSGWYGNRDNEDGDAVGIIVEGNTLKNLCTGINYSLTEYGVLLKDNIFVDCAANEKQNVEYQQDQEAVIKHLTRYNSVTVIGGYTGDGAENHYLEGATVTLKLDTAAIPENAVFTGWRVTSGNVTLASDAAEETTFTMPGGVVTIEAVYNVTPAEPEYSVSVEGHSLTLDGTIGVDYYLNLPAEVISDLTSYNVVFTLPNMGSTTYTVSAASGTPKTVTLNGTEQQLYLFTCPIAAKEMTGTIYMQVVKTDGTWKSEVFEYTAQTYAKYILDNASNYSDELVALVKDMLNYGTAAQEHFGYNTDVLANSILADADKTVSTFGNIDYSDFSSLPTTDESDTVDFVGAALILESETGLRLYLNVAEGTTVTAALEGTVPAGVTLKEYKAKPGSGYTGYIEIAGIAAKDLDEKFTVKITASDNSTVTVQHSPMKYSLNVQKGSYDTSLQTLLAALYDYNAAANAYFTN